MVRTDNALERELEGKGKGAFRHYQTKVFELMSSLGYVDDMRFHGVRESPRSCYLELIRPQSGRVRVVPAHTGQAIA